jgi:hypothetical protein
MVALLAAGALGLHELRYRLAFGSTADEILERTGHGAVTGVGAVVGIMLLLALTRLLLGVASDGRGTGLRLRRLWPLASAGLLAIFAAQELVEGLLSGGHPSGLHGLVGHGGWIAVPLAVVLGGVVAGAAIVARHVASVVPPALRVPRPVLCRCSAVLLHSRDDLPPRRRREALPARRGPPLLNV